MKKKQITTKELVKVTCDKCGTEIKEESSNDYYDFSLNFAVGKSYPDGGYGDGWTVDDLCENCAEYLRKLLVEHEFNVTEYDF